MSIISEKSSLLHKPTNKELDFVGINDDHDFQNSNKSSKMGEKTQTSNSNKNKTTLSIILNHTLRLFLMALLIFNVVCQSEYTQYAYGYLYYKNYYFLCWVSYSFLSISFPIYLLYFCIKWVIFIVLRKDIKYPFEKLTSKRVLGFFGIAGVFTPLVLFSGYMWFVSLDYIPVAVNTALGQSLNVFVFIFSFIFCLKTEKKFIWLKGIILLIVVVGLIFLALSGGQSTESFPHAWFGVLMDVANALLYSLYEVGFTFSIERFFHKISPAEIFFFQSCIGFVCFLGYWWVTLIFHILNIETFVINWEIFQFLMISSFLVVTYEILLCIILSFTKTPFYISMSLMLAIPIALLIDVLFRGVVIDVWGVFAMIIIIISVFLLNIVEFIPRRKDKFSIFICRIAAKLFNYKGLKEEKEETQ